MSVRVETRGAIYTVILDRPERKNAVDRETAEALADAWEAFDADPEFLVGVFASEGGTFCAGADLKAFAAGTPNRIEPERRGPMGPSRMLLSKPVIAAIEGYAVAGGLELALWCDLRVAAEDAILGVFCRRYGVPLIDGGTVRLPRLIGLSCAMDLILTGRPVNAEEALAMGLVNRVVQPGDARRAAEDLAEELSRFPQQCMRADRLSAYSAFDGSIEDALAREFRDAEHVLSTEAIEGARRFSNAKGSD